MAEPKETKASAIPANKPPRLNFILDLVNNPRVQRICGYIVAIVVFSYMLVAMLSFIGVVPKTIARNLPFISGVINRADELSELSQSQSMDAYHLNTKIVYPKFSRAYRKEDPYASLSITQSSQEQPKDQVVMKRQFVNGKNIGEVYINDQLVIRISTKADYVNEFARADAMADQLKNLLSKKADILKLSPGIVSGNMSLVLASTVVGQVYPQDAILNNSTTLQQALAWINNIRISLGITKALTLADFSALDSIPTQNLAPAPVVAPVAVEPTAQVAAPVVDRAATDKEKQKLMKKVVSVYNTMPSGQALDIFNKMTDEQAVEILAQMKNRQLSKILAIMEPGRAARITELIAEKKASR